MSGQVDPAAVAAHLDDLARVAQAVAEDLRNGLAYLPNQEPYAGVKPDADGLLTAKALSKLLLANARTVRRWRQEPGFPKPLRMRGPLRWRRADIEKWIAGRAK